MGSGSLWTPVKLNIASAALRWKFGHYQIIIGTNKIAQRAYNKRMHSNKVTANST